jgi:DNA mismatch repair protein MutS2
MTQQERITALRNSLDQGAGIPLVEFKDIRSEIKRCRVSGAFFTSENLLELANILQLIDELRRHFQKHSLALKPVAALILELDTLQPILREIRHKLDPDGRLRDHASPELNRIRKSIQYELQHLHSEMARLMETASNEGWLHEENPTIREGRLVLPLRTEFKRKVQGVIHGQSGTGATTYVEPIALIEINNRRVELEQEEKEAIETILKEITENIRPHFETLEQNISCLIELDCLNACARFSQRFECYPPQLTEEPRDLILNMARHPLLALVKTVVPLQLVLPEKVRTLILTGPNAGGKTVAMKTVGLLAQMAMCGLPIPAGDGSQIPFFDQFLMDIGDRQSIYNDLSTFSSHVSHLKDFLESATARSLILIDELGTGTDPLEGAALGQAILEQLIDKGALTIVTTHHNALKAFADQNPRVLNAAMEFDTHSLSPTYGLRTGIPGSSYALEISRRLGITAEVIKRARSIMGSDTAHLENLLLEMETVRQRLAEKDKDLSRNKRTLDKLIQEYETKVQSLREKYSRADRELAEQLEIIVHESRARIEQTVKDIREKQASRDTILTAHQMTEEISQTARHHLPSPGKSASSEQVAELRKGLWVKVNGISESGQITDPALHSRRIGVEIKGKTIWVSRETVEPLAEQPAETERTAPLVAVQADTAPSSRLDLRGLRVDEAEQSLLKFLDQALLSGLKHLEIVHGKGTGALQKLVWDILRDYPAVRHFEFDHFDRGGTGMTVVEI